LGWRWTATVAEAEVCLEFKGRRMSDNWIEWKNRAEKALFLYGKQILGKTAGGMINRLYREKGFDYAIEWIAISAQKQDPREFLGAALKEKETKEVQSAPAGWQFVEVGTAAWKEYEDRYKAAHNGRGPLEQSWRVDGRIKQGRYISEASA
jgi:hypothetical protein